MDRSGRQVWKWQRKSYSHCLIIICIKDLWSSTTSYTCTTSPRSWLSFISDWSWNTAYDRYQLNYREVLCICSNICGQNTAHTLHRKKCLYLWYNIYIYINIINYKPRSLLRVWWWWWCVLGLQTRKACHNYEAVWDRTYLLLQTGCNLRQWPTQT